MSRTNITIRKAGGEAPVSIQVDAGGVYAEAFAGTATAVYGIDPLDLPLLATTDITYLGYYRAPQVDAYWGMYYNNGGIVFNAANNSLIVGGDPGQSQVGEIAIPAQAPVTSGTAPMATQLQSAVQLTASLRTWFPEGLEASVCGFTLTEDSRLLVHVSSFYNNEHTQQNSVFALSSLSLSTATRSGPYKIAEGISPTSANRTFGLGGGSILPSKWRPVFGNYDAVAGGAGEISTIQSVSNGPCMFFFNTWNFQGASNSSGTAFGRNAAVYYNNPESPGDLEGPFSSFFTAVSKHRGTFFLENSRTIICVGRHGDSSYVDGGFKSSTQAGQVFWLYDARDVKQAFDGARSPSSVMPYARRELNLLSLSSGNREGEGARGGGAAFDPATGRIYQLVLEDEGLYSRIYVYQVAI